MSVFKVQWNEIRIVPLLEVVQLVSERPFRSKTMHLLNERLDEHDGVFKIAVLYDDIIFFIYVGVGVRFGIVSLRHYHIFELRPNYSKRHHKSKFSKCFRNIFSYRILKRLPTINDVFVNLSN